MQTCGNTSAAGHVVFGGGGGGLTFFPICRRQRYGCDKHEYQFQRFSPFRLGRRSLAFSDLAVIDNRVTRRIWDHDLARAEERTGERTNKKAEVIAMIKRAKDVTLADIAATTG